LDRHPEFQPAFLWRVNWLAGISGSHYQPLKDPEPPASRQAGVQDDLEPSCDTPPWSWEIVIGAKGI